MHTQGPSDDRRVVSNRTMEIVVALFFLAASAVVIMDSVRLGFHWRENEGPASGYFPFYIAVIMAFASIVNLVSAVLGRAGNGGDTFVSRQALGRVLAVLIPAAVYVAVMKYVGLYVASAAFIFTFMMLLGREGLVKSLCVSIGVPLVLFFMFEIWFLVPLPKGPLEDWLGY